LPRLIYCSITGYGTDSPYAARPGFDLVIQGVTGLISVTGHDDEGLAKVPVPIVDGTAALHATTAILAALRHRDFTGEGATIDISLQASTMTWMMLLAAGFFATGEPPRRIGAGHPFAAPYEVYESADGPLTIAAGNERQWEKLCGALGCQQLMRDRRYATNTDRARHRHELAEDLAPILARHGREELIELLSDAGVPCGPVYGFSEALADAALVERGLIVDYWHPLAGPTKTIGNPIDWEGYVAPLSRPPLHGEHTRAVREEVGLAADVHDEEAVDAAS
jgi:crotonobetainyl-CoA:carnitine CoA-transferase CaiB-like acyl-CoA transferase